MSYLLTCHLVSVVSFAALAPSLSGGRNSGGAASRAFPMPLAMALCMPRGVCLKILLQGLFALCLLGWSVDHRRGARSGGGREVARRVKSGAKVAEGENQRRLTSVVP